ncbi:GGDEF domain-containing protein [Demequina activiva]|uniref:GGDEF domain-containing protein n=1 Tax=Demequina activiva TaxID=1582364 RepID=A0A919Q204_9MICO|nr:GGDEF domain-containing protein [Demequina activiva]GIG54757.1 hypothetical protein Dac01nite_15090 [Demequina activiva]
MGAEDASVNGRQLSDIVGRVLDRRVGRLGGEAGRAVSTTHAIAVFGLIITLSYTAFFATYDFEAFRGLVALNAAFCVAYLGMLLLARLGRQLAAALALLCAAIAQLLISTAWVGWEAGLHLYLLLAAQLVFMVFTQRQRPLRWIFAAVALAAFLLAQLTMPASGAVVQMADVILNTMLSVNALLVASMLFILAAYSHYRAEKAQADASESAARAEYLANTDALTGLATRRPVMERLEVLSQAGGDEYCLALADLDHFKAINDAHGHACGDAVLAEVGTRLRTSLRVSDSVGRWGGEEFIFVLPDASLGDATIMMERVRSRVGSTSISCGDHEHAITVSIGLTAGDYAGTPHHAIRRADDALYEAKAAGRDRVCVTRAVEPSAAPAVASESETAPPKPRRRAS